VVRAMLQYRGYEVEEASGGHKGIESHAAAHPPFHLVLVDVGMPDLDGVSVVRRMRERQPGLRVILMTGGDGLEGQAMAEEAQAGFLLKPFTREQLLDAVRRGMAGKPEEE
jgi:DNA-binding response OmpR family regulator